MHYQNILFYALVFFNKSGISLHQRFDVGAQVIDEDYQGEVHLHVINTSKIPQTIKPGQKLLQGLLLPVLYSKIKEVPESELHTTKTERGSGGFGSTGHD